jgi:hypothetical protein
MEMSTTREAKVVTILDSFPAFHGTRWFNTEFSSALHLFLSGARPIHSISPDPTSPRFILISTLLRLGLPSGFFPFEVRSYFNVLVSSTLVGLATRYYFLPEICGLVSVGRPLWREDGSAICSVITQRSESRRTRNHTAIYDLTV